MTSFGYEIMLSRGFWFQTLDVNKPWRQIGETRESWAMFYILYHSAEMKFMIPKLNVVCKTFKGLLALYNVTVGPIAAVYPQEGYRKKW